MEEITNISQIPSLTDNKIYAGISSPTITRSKITFLGKNNILYLEPNVSIIDSSITFRGSNAIVYLSSTSASPYRTNIFLSNESTIYFGRNNYINDVVNNPLFLFATERQNILIGNECLFSYGICMRTADPHLVYDCNTHKRINPSKSILIGDHIWFGQESLLLKGTIVGSGSIIGARSVIANKRISSNVAIAGNPARIIKQNVFFSSGCVHDYLEADTEHSISYDNDKFIYHKSNKNIDMTSIDALLKSISDPEQKLKELTQLSEISDSDRFYIG